MQVMTTLVPPDVEPEVGLMLETVGMVILLVTSAQIKFPVAIHGPGRDKRTAKGRGPINSRKLGFAVEWPEDKADTEPK